MDSKEFVTLISNIKLFTFSKDSSIIIFLILLYIFIKALIYKFRYIRFPYRKREFLFTKSEKAFFDVLNPIFMDYNYYVFAKVRIADLLYVPKNSKNSMGFFNKIACKHVDFVICDKDEIIPVLAIELDDSSHNRPDRIERDIFVDKAFRTAKFPILHIPVQKKYDSEELKRIIFSLI